MRHETWRASSFWCRSVILFCFTFLGISRIGLLKYLTAGLLNSFGQSIWKRRKYWKQAQYDAYAMLIWLHALYTRHLLCIEIVTIAKLSLALCSIWFARCFGWNIHISNQSGLRYGANLFELASSKAVIYLTSHFLSFFFGTCSFAIVVSSEKGQTYTFRVWPGELGGSWYISYDLIFKRV